MKEENNKLKISNEKEKSQNSSNTNQTKEEMIKEGLLVPGDNASGKNNLDELEAKDIFDPVGKQVKKEEKKNKKGN